MINQIYKEPPRQAQLDPIEAKPEARAEVEALGVGGAIARGIWTLLSVTSATQKVTTLIFVEILRTVMKLDKNLKTWVNAMHVWCTETNTLRSVPNQVYQYAKFVILLAIIK